MSLFIPMFIYAFSMAITPGPNNLIALTTGVNYGFRRAMPFTFGVVVGFNIMLSVVGFGFGEMIATSDRLMEFLGYIGVGFIVYMGYKTMTAPTEITTKEDSSAGFIHGVMFQWVNPKAWTACLGGIAAFNIAGNVNGILLYIAISIFVVLFSVGLWAYAGSKITKFLEDQRNHRIFNIVMGGSLMLVGVYILFMDKVT
ncbi:MAG: LysE family translocator [Kordiimonadaceae bacterium]|jgi:threonine/homoserine/homoserine lactone efflux protein|nr:LysE family translocator [Kordiimonadaceae bacterium]MBT6033761.1 LysE family translocator [Kordiimonadaceae bacterium]MBT6329309.1 LysE family translocator [Kordiimonadaceae bacterium]MBT7583334.1 LysE family translocator [Kordiimonadaceae bacterium]